MNHLEEWYTEWSIIQRLLEKSEGIGNRFEEEINEINTRDKDEKPSWPEADKEPREI